MNLQYLFHIRLNMNISVLKDPVDCEIAESRIYDYYDFYDIKNNDIDITQEYTVFIDFYSNIFNITTTKYSSIKKIDTFEVIYFSRE